MDKVIAETHYLAKMPNDDVDNYQKYNYNEWDKTYNYSQNLEEFFPCLAQKYVKITEDIALFNSYKLGSGAFGKVYYGLDVHRKKELAIKIQSTKTSNDLLAKENYFLNQLKESPGFPDVHFYGEWKGHKVMAQDLLGPSLDKVFKFCNKQFKIYTVLKLGINMFDLLEVIHRNNILHRDIKPNNFVYGTYDSKFRNLYTKIHLIDFGLSCFLHEANGKHCEWNNKSSFVGTPRYASLNTHHGIRQSRRDDLESLAYVLIYFAKGSLPWQGVKAKTKEERKEMIKTIKKKISPKELCEGLPDIFINLVDLIKSMSYDDKPHYELLRWMFMVYNNNILNKNQSANQIKENVNFTQWEWEEVISQCNNGDLKDEINELFEGYPFDHDKYKNFLNRRKGAYKIYNK